jgi:hypothetical protein
MTFTRRKTLNNKALKNVGRKWYAWFVIKNKSLCRKRILVSFAEAAQRSHFGQGQRFCGFC